MVALIVSALVVVALCWVTISPRDAWPFSSYPMFARYWSEPVVRFYRLSFVLPNGSRKPLPSATDRLADEFHRDFAAVWRGSAVADPRPASIVEHYRQRAIRADPALRMASEIVVHVGLVQLGAEHGAGVAEQVALVCTPPPEQRGGA